MFALNPEQRRAVEHGEGPLLVVAGPGSGKTRVITERIVYLLERVPGLEPPNILAVTFTEKAAGEMKGRVARALGEPPSLPHISTFHSFCYEVLRKRHFDRRLLDKVDVWIFLRRRMEQLGLEFYRKLVEPGAFLHDLNDFFSRCQDELIDPEDFEAHVAGVAKEFERVAGRLDPEERCEAEENLRKLHELARVFRSSRRLIEEAGCSSLGSLISETVRLFDREPEVLSAYRARFRYVLVDEFQDSNFAQVELLRRLAGPPHNITAVGDDDQAIYRFRGAAHGAFEMFAKAFGKPETVFLNRNYRSTKKILSVADAAIALNTGRGKKPKLLTEKAEGERVFLLSSDDYRSEAAWVAEEIERLKRHGTVFGDIAVLYRAHSYRDPLVEEFRRRGVPFAIRGLSVLSTVILRDLVAYLRLVHSPHESISLTRVLLVPRWRFPEELSLEVRRRAAKDRCSLADAIQTMRRSLFQNEIERTGWPELEKLLSELRAAAARLPMTKLFDRLADRLGLAFLPGDPDEAYVAAFRRFLEEWEEKSETRRLDEFMEYFAYFQDAGGKVEAPEPAERLNAVQMMSVHAAKGLEFPVVFLISVAPRRFPTSERKPVIEFPDALRRAPAPPENIHLQEERRLFFVALTRAMERLYVSGVAKGGRKPSVFVEDLLTDTVLMGRDLESISVPAVEPEAAAERAVAAPARVRRGAQRGLFSEGSEAPASIYPDLARWAAAPPPNPPDGKLSLSATAIETYRDCPLKFKLGHFLRIPTGPQAALTFGNVMHQAVRHYFELRKLCAAPPAAEAVEKFFLERWRGAGFEDSYQEQAYQKAGLEQLRAFVERQNALALDASKVRSEENFRLDLGDVVLEGRIDQISPLAHGRHQDVELTDYKTGKPRSAKEAEKSLQLSIYALAAREQLGLNPARLTFYNLTSNEAVSSVRTAKDLERALAEVRQVAEQIRARLFPPAPGFACRFCDYVPICPAHEETV
jgi:DNA helicase-2/ATP-dependent DNA helicase PcrA